MLAPADFVPTRAAASAEELEALVALCRGRRVVALTGAGCSTESGIPDYRGEGTERRAREPIRYQVTLEPHSRPWIFVLDAAADQPEVQGMVLRMSRQLQWFSDRPVTDLLRYTAQSHVDFSHGPMRRR